MKINKFTRALLPGVLLFASQLTNAEILTLQNAYQLAIKNDPQWAAINKQYKANQEVRIQRRAALLPQLGLSGSYTSAESEPEGIDRSTESDTTQYSIALSQTLFDLTKWHSYQSGKALNSQYEAEFKQSNDEFFLRVVTLYLEVLRANANLEYQKAEQDAIARQLEQSKQRFEVGLVAITDVLEAQAAYDTATSKRISAESSQFVALRALETLTGGVVDNVVDMDKSLPILPPEPLDLNQWVETGLENNPGLQAAIFTTRSAEQEYKSARGVHAPTVSFEAGYQDTDLDSDDLSNTPFDSSGTKNSIGINISMPLYTGGGTSANRRQAQYSYLALKDTENLRRRQTIQDTTNFYQLMVSSVAQVNASKQSTKSAEVALEATEAGYEAGTRTIVDVLNVQRTLYQNQSNYANARFDYVLNGLRLKQAAGTLIEEDVLALNQWMAKPTAASTKTK